MLHILNDGWLVNLTGCKPSTKKEHPDKKRFIKPKREERPYKQSKCRCPVWACLVAHADGHQCKRVQHQEACRLFRSRKQERNNNE